MMRLSSYALAGSVCIGLVEEVSITIFPFDLPIDGFSVQVRVDDHRY